MNALQDVFTSKFRMQIKVIDSNATVIDSLFGCIINSPYKYEIINSQLIIYKIDLYVIF